ncbi:5-formyltetrahydrofolate cyclo-ligase [uncultured Alistipes sp.]|uniref:5-formyltetrahydrofolate cyclo-ligase n=1 Tax=uncultured Alistipes sp. TaxID=538949 RepID=UPI0025FA7AA8|nr:5-formyltetrahydrofolate cyclo-ligase [uncultured Alistipes sp.]
MPKKKLRMAMKRRNLSLTPCERAAASELIFGRAERLTCFPQVRCAALFCALPDEPATEAVLARWSAFMRVVVPRVEGDTMRFYDYDPTGLCAGAFGILEPVVATDAEEPDVGQPDAAPTTALSAGMQTSVVASCPSVAAPCDPVDIDLIVVPGVAFTVAGARMGRGRGYYDKYLSQSGLRAVKIGVCYAHQLVPELLVEPHDVFMDCVITNI